jgi:hypothetical protein
MVKYQSMLYENLHIRLEVVETLNPATLLPIFSGPLEHDCLEVMVEVFSSWPALTDQPTIRMLNVSQMAPALSGMAHTSLVMQWLLWTQ